MLLAALAMLVLCLLPLLGMIVLAPLYLGMAVGGTALFLLCCADTVRLRKAKRRLGNGTAVTSGPRS